MMIDAGLEDTDCIVWGVETLESVDTGDTELDLDPNNCDDAEPTAEERLKPLVASWPPFEVVEDDGVVIFTAGWEDDLNDVNGGDTARGVALGVDTVDANNSDVKGVGPGFSWDDTEDKVVAAVNGGATDSALRIGMSLIFGDGDDDVEREAVVMWPNPRFT